MAKNKPSVLDSRILNELSYYDYLDRLSKIALSVFEWVNIPSSMDSRFLEKTLFEFGRASMLYDEQYGFINTQCATNGHINIYGLPTALNCYAFTLFKQNRPVYNGLDEAKGKDEECILVQNTWDGTPTLSTLQLFAMRLAQADRVCDVNLNAQKTPYIIITDENQRFTMKNVYKQINSNEPVIYGAKNFNMDNIKILKTDAPYIIDKVTKYKTDIWNEALTFLGINNLTEKKERLISDEADSNNELINMNLQSYLAPRKHACDQFNEKYGENIDVRVRSDLYNIIKQNNSIISDYNNDGIVDSVDADDRELNIDLIKGLDNE